MKKLTCTITCCLLCLTAYLQEKPEWQDETIPFVGKEYPQTSFMTYGDTDKARKNDFKISADYKNGSSIGFRHTRIWDWIDQGILVKDENGTPYWVYGGDFGENTPGKPLAMKEEGNNIHISGEAVEFVFNKQTGFPSSYKVNDIEYIHDGFGFQPNFWRGPTDNDYGRGMPKHSQSWRQAGKTSRSRISGHQHPIQARN